MSKVEIADKDTADLFFTVFESAQGIERRVFRIISRSHFNRLAIDELIAQATSIRDDLNYLRQMAVEAENAADADDDDAEEGAS